MTDIEISKALALAIGWIENKLDKNGCNDSDIAVFGYSEIPESDEVKVWTGTKWRTFDYQDPTVIWPIAERYSVFPSSVSNGDYAAAEKQGYPINRQWECLRWHYEKINGKARGWVRYEADTAAKAAALAVIGGAA